MTSARIVVALLAAACASEPVQPPGPAILDTAVDVLPGETGPFRWGVGVSTGAGFQASLQFNKRNFGAPGTTISDYRIHGVEPDMFDPSHARKENR